MLSDLQDQAVRELIVWLAHGLQVRGEGEFGDGGGGGEVRAKLAKSNT